jgi:hypothetical protein
MGEMTNAYKMSETNLKVRDDLGDLAIDLRIIFK